MWHVWETLELHIEFWWSDLRERNHSENLGVDGMIIYFNIILFKK